MRGQSKWIANRLAAGVLALGLASGASGEMPQAPRASGAPAARPAAATPSDAAPSIDASGDGLVRAQRSIAEREYQARPSREGLQAPNRAQNLRTWFEPTGIRVHDRTAPGSPKLVELRLAGVGRGASLAPLAPGQVSSEGARVQIRREGMVEWYENSASGLEQGFTLAKRPAGEGPLAVELAVAGAQASLRGDVVALRSETGRRLSYGRLSTMDASGAALAARFEVPGPGRVRILVEDAGAPYPIEIDPLLTETADTQFEADQVFASLGTSVASAGDVDGDGYADVIVGAPGYDAGEAEEGAAFVFLGSATGIADGSPSTPGVAQLESNQASAQLGQSVASAGDVNGDGYADVIVGAYLYDAGEENEGAAFVFLGSASGIADGSPSTPGVAQLESNQASAQLGQSVASAGDVNGDGYADVIVGANQYDAGQAFEGAAFLFLGSASGIPDGSPATAAAQLESDQDFSNLGYSVASAGDVNGDGYADVIVGAYLYDAGQTNEGAAFLFLGSATGIADGSPATAAAQLESDQDFSNLGYSVASAGDVNGDGYADVIVGAYLYDAGHTNEGAAFVFLGSATGVADGSPATAAAQLESNQTFGNLGASVASAGDVNGDGYADVIVSALSYDVDQTDEGAAFVFLGSAAGIADGSPATATAQLESNQASSGVDSVASAGDVNGDGYADVIVGAQLYEAGQNDEGAAFVYLGGGTGIADGNPSTAAAQLESDQAGASLGFSVASAGDVNGDGYADVIVGAPSYDAGQANEGAAFIFLGSASGIADGDPSTAATQLESNQASAFLGLSVASAGDVNGDGYADVIVGASGYNAGQDEEGAAFVFLGSSTGIVDGNPGVAAAQLESDQDFSNLGWSVASAGDVNGDGYADVIVGAYRYDAGQEDEGAAFVFLGSASGIADGNPATAAARLESDQPFDELEFIGPAFGASVDSAGDVNGDGYADVIVGAGNYDAGQGWGEGAAFVFLGSATGIPNGNPATASTTLESNQASALLGVSVASAGDVNGDGYADVIVGASSYTFLQTDEGLVFVFLGSATGIPSTAASARWSNQAGAHLGSSVASAGDVNGDGYADVIVGAPFYDAVASDEGAAFVLLGSATGLAGGDLSTAAAQLESNQAGASLGFSVASAGDVNGDGYADVIVGAGSYDAGQTDEGAAFVFYGNANATGRPVLARQLRGDSSGTPVQPWGLAYSQSGFEVELAAMHPEGRGRVKAELEACPAGVPFGDAGCTSATTPSWVAVTPGAPVATLSHTFSGLAGDTLYRWRARVLHAPSSVTAGGITAPPNPAHGPWRRLGAQAVEADLRTALPLPPDDGDGVPASVEAAAPNGGDGNGDGTPDAIQSSVASLPDTGASYVTIQVSGGCAALTNVAVIAESGAPAPDPGYDYAFGVAQFQLACSTASVKLFFHGSSSLAPPYRKYGPIVPGSPGTAQWYSLNSAVFGSQLVGGNTVATVTLSFSDGALGDATGVDGVIVDPGGPALLVDADLDGVLDAVDNCTDVANASQLDSDGDGCGNDCDADFDQNGITGGTDFNTLRLCFGQSVPGSGPAEDPTCAEADLDGNLVVGGTDFNGLRLGFGKPPGPGAACPF